MSTGFFKSRHLVRAFVLVQFGVLVAACSPMDPNNPQSGEQTGIIAGQAVSDQDPLSLSTLHITIRASGDTFMCSGSLIAPDLVLTAAHCVDNRTEKRHAYPTEVTIDDITNPGDPGMFTWFTTSTSVRVIGVAVHPGFTSPLNDKYELGEDRRDIALLRLAQPLKAPYRPAQLLEDSFKLADDTSVVVAGYGIRTTNEQIDNRQLFEYGKMEVLNVESKNHIVVSLDVLALGGTASGDSGGPALIRESGVLKLWGVASSGKNEDVISVADYSDIRQLRTWVATTAKKMGASALPKAWTLK